MFANSMSLINDALRKARKAQPAGNASGPDLLPVEADAGGRGGSIFTLPFIIAVVLVMAGVLIWAWYRAGSVDLVVRGNTGAATVSEAKRANEPTKIVAPRVAAKTETATSVTTVASTPAVVASTDAGLTNVLTVAEAPKPAVTVYKLEGIFYSAKKPTAVINGDLVSVGSRVEAGRVVAIDEESATVVTEAGETNLLVLTR
jgi:flagellar basal body-associated protein FliL